TLTSRPPVISRSAGSRPMQTAVSERVTSQSGFRISIASILRAMSGARHRTGPELTKGVEKGAITRAARPLRGALHGRPLAPLAEADDQLPFRLRGGQVGDVLPPAHRVAREIRRALVGLVEAGRDGEGIGPEALLAPEG